MARSQALLRVLASLLLLMVACLLGLDTQTKDVLLVTKKATFRDLNSLCVVMYLFPIAAGYNLLRLCINTAFFSAWFKENLRSFDVITLAWVGFLLDQIAVYITFASNSRALQGSIMAITGQDDFQWMKLCDKFTRFCLQVGGSLMCGYIACFAMIVIASLSAFNLFRFYSPKRFLLVKSA